MKSALVLLLAASAAGAETFAITNARIVPVSGPPIDRATLVVRDDRIAALGTKIQIPSGARRIDGTGLTIYPGWIDGWTRVGLSEISAVAATVDVQEVGPFNPAANAWVALNPHSEMIRTARVNGVTTALVAPAGGQISGTASAVNLLGKYPNDMVVLSNAGVVLNIPSLHRGGGAASEMSASGADSGDARRKRVAEDLEKLKQYLREARRYAEMRARGGANTPPGAMDNSLEAMVPLMRGERPAICVADHFRDIRAALQLGDEFGLKIVIAGGADAWKVADLLKEKKAGVLYSGVHELPRVREDPYDTSFTTPATLQRAGVPFAIVSGSSADVRNLPYRASMAAAYGLEQDDAVRSITLAPAQLLGIADKVGSLEVGKIANLLVTRGDPLDVRSEIRYVFVAGKLVPPENRNLEMYEQFGAPAEAPVRKKTP